MNVKKKTSIAVCVDYGKDKEKIMEVIRMGIGNIQASPVPLSACIGYFDGLHLGHQQLVRNAIQSANEKNGQSALITFDPDPWQVLKNIDDIDHLTTMEERIKIGASLGIEKWIILEFTKELASLSPDAFLNEILIPMNIQTLVCGFDYHYGCRGLGNIETLKQQQAFEVKVISEVDYEEEKISSTRIEKAISQGQMELSEKLLGRPYSLCGIVVRGNHIGTNILGFPTANLELSASYVIPQRGVYVGACLVQDQLIRSMINIGHNPTCNHRDKLSVEAHLIDFNADLYGQPIVLYFYEKLRDEVKFNSADELIDQLNKDRLSTKNYIRKEGMACV